MVEVEVAVAAVEFEAVAAVEVEPEGEVEVAAAAESEAASTGTTLHMVCHMLAMEERRTAVVVESWPREREHETDYRSLGGGFVNMDGIPSLC